MARPKSTQSKKASTSSKNTKSKPKKKMGRPPIEIDKNLFEGLCQMQATEAEIANLFECDIDTVNNWCKRTYGKTFKQVFEEKSVKGKISLRRLQFKSAEAGNVTMQIWLGKQYLGQTEKQEQTIQDANITFEIAPASSTKIDTDEFDD